MVATIDPARRLADAIGIPELGNQPTEVFRPAGADVVLAAMMLDTKATFDGVVNRSAASPAQAEAIMADPFYRKHGGHAPHPRCSGLPGGAPSADPAPQQPSLSGGDCPGAGGAFRLVGAAAFVLVSSARADALAEAVWFAARAGAAGFANDAVIVNRVSPPHPSV